MLRLVVWLYHTRCGPLLSHVLHVTCCCRLVIPHPVWSAIESHITCYMLQVVVWSCHTRCGPSLWYLLLIEIPLLSSPLLLSQLCVPFLPFPPPPSSPPFLPPSIFLLSMFTRYMLHVTRYCPITFSRWLYTGLWPGQRWRLGSGGLFGPSDLLPSGRHCG